MILGIKNRTENWKTARTFGRMYPENVATLANSLLKSYCEFPDCNLPNLQPGQVRLELFWKGVRDHVHRTKEKGQAIVEEFALLYKQLFPHLRENIVDFTNAGKHKFNDLKSDNYDVSTLESKKKLFSNLLNTEIDIVLEAPNHIFIGEAKLEMSLKGDSNNLLVHQIIRQYVTAKLLLKHLKCDKTLVPFIVKDKRRNPNLALQTRFMVHKGWLKKENILRWEDVEQSARA